LVGARRFLLARNCSIVGYRLTTTDPAQARQSIVVNTLASGSVSGLAPAGDQAEGNAWMAGLKGASGIGHRQLWMRGIPPSWTLIDTDGKTPKPDPSFYTAFNNWINACKGGNLQIRVIQPIAAAGAGIKTNITILAPQALTGLASLAMGTPGNIDATKPVTISGFRAPLSIFNGTYLPNVSFTVSAGTIVLTHKPCSVGQGAQYNAGAFARQTTYTYPNITDAALLAPRWRETGKDFFVRRGRRSK
jgi:hypothetical protein